MIRNIGGTTQISNQTIIFKERLLCYLFIDCNVLSTCLGNMNMGVGLRSDQPGHVNPDFLLCNRVALIPLYTQL